MADKSATPEVLPESPDASAAPSPAPATPPVPPKRSPGHRGADVKDTVAEMTAKAHEISLEAGSKMAAAMKDVINAAAGITGFVLESARDLVQYMVRRGQMTQEEADKLIKQAEEANAGRPPVAERPQPVATEAAGSPPASPPAAHHSLAPSFAFARCACCGTRCCATRCCRCSFPDPREQRCHRVEVERRESCSQAGEQVCGEIGREVRAPAKGCRKAVRARAQDCLA